MTTFCSCESPIMDVAHDAGCRRCGLPVDFTPASDHAAVAMDATFAALAAPPRCAVCGGPDGEGNGCEFCPAVEQRGKCERCGTLQPLDAAGKVKGHKAPRARNYCVGGGNVPRRQSITFVNPDGSTTPSYLRLTPIEPST